LITGGLSGIGAYLTRFPPTAANKLKDEKYRILYFHDGDIEDLATHSTGRGARRTPSP